MKKYTTWLKVAATLQIITALFHSLSFLNNLQPANESEKQLLELMNNYRLDLGVGFTPSMGDLMTSFSICVSLLLFMSGSINWFLIKQRAAPDIMKGIIIINLIIFTVCFTAMLTLTFLPPILCTGLIFISLLISYFTIPSTKK